MEDGAKCIKKTEAKRGGKDTQTTRDDWPMLKYTSTSVKRALRHLSASITGQRLEVFDLPPQGT